MPRAYARFLTPVATLLLVAVITAAGLIARGQRSPGDGRWDDEELTAFEGIICAEPYAMIRVPGGGTEGPAATVLLVEEGKLGAKERVRPFDGRPVRVTGTLMHRDGVRMLELAAGEDGLQPVPQRDGALEHLCRTPPQPLGRVILRGEIVGSKCYLGAMKPGGGGTHKGCAVLCLKGGVPPLFAARNAAGRRVSYLLTGEAGGPLGTEVFDLVGEPVHLDADLGGWGDLLVLRAASGSFRRP